MFCCADSYTDKELNVNKEVDLSAIAVKAEIETDEAGMIRNWFLMHEGYGGGSSLFFDSEINMVLYCNPLRYLSDSLYRMKKKK